jgi:hypothetical protein
MKEKNFARSWMGMILALLGLLISIPASYMFQGELTRYAISFPEYLQHLPELFGKVDKYDTHLIGMRNTVVWTAVCFTVGGFVIGAVIKLIIAASRGTDASAFSNK